MKLSEGLRKRALKAKYRFVYDDVRKKVPAEIMSFNCDGFRHLIRRGKDKRPTKDMRHRLSYLPLVPEIIKNCPTPVEIRGQLEKFGGELIMVQYLAFEMSINDRLVRIIAKQIAGSTPRFQSIFEVQ